MAPLRSDAKGHVCPPSNATHPSDRWESLFVYSFICKFTNLRGKVDGLESPMDLEECLMTKEANPVLMQILKAFVLNLRPQTRNLGIEQISATISGVLADYFKTSERSVFWDDTLRRNVDPLHDLQGTFFEASWDLKLKMLRQLVELQLSHSVDIKAKVDRAWGVAPTKSKKKEAATAHVNTDLTQADLQIVPVGQDINRKRYWVADASPRIYVSTNPWKTTSTFESIASTREEFLNIIEQLKQELPNDPESSRPPRPKKIENQHLALIKSLEERVPLIDAEISRIDKARRRAEQKLALYAQAELRETRTRRQTKKPDYVYAPEYESDGGEGDEYKQDDEGFEEDDDFINDNEEDDARPSRGRRAALPTRNANGKRESSSDDPWAGLRDERRRSTRLGNVEPPPKRARTDESSVSMNSAEAGPSTRPENGHGNGMKLKASGAAALKPTEVALEQIAGKRKSKFWVYAVPAEAEVAPKKRPEEVHDEAMDVDVDVDVEANGRDAESTVSHSNGNGNGSDYHRSLEGSLSPMHSS
ncbi:hypothetical protein BDZ89DRAFT_1090131 [Hymenopellis radicata]|nr:hypothetical protein BDZ89DRAFT_1090131 [Hymenopellis radicata]